MNAVVEQQLSHLEQVRGVDVETAVAQHLAVQITLPGVFGDLQGSEDVLVHQVDDGASGVSGDEASQDPTRQIVVGEVGAWTAERLGGQEVRHRRLRGWVVACQQLLGLFRAVPGRHGEQVAYPDLAGHLPQLFGQDLRPQVDQTVEISEMPLVDRDAHGHGGERLGHRVHQ